MKIFQNNYSALYKKCWTIVVTVLTNDIWRWSNTNHTYHKNLKTGFKINKYLLKLLKTNNIPPSFAINVPKLTLSTPATSALGSTSPCHVSSEHHPRLPRHLPCQQVLTWYLPRQRGSPQKVKKIKIKWSAHSKNWSGIIVVFRFVC